MYKQNSLIARYCLAAVVLLALLGPLVGESWGRPGQNPDFTLRGDEQLIVNSSYGKGELYDTSCAFIGPGGWAYILNAYDSSTVDILFGGVDYLYAYDSSTISISDGTVYGPFYAYDSSTINISGGRVSGNLYAYDSSAVNISGGSVGGLYASDSSTVNISGGIVNYLRAYDSSIVNIPCDGYVIGLNMYDSSAVAISGGSVPGDLYARDSSTVNIAAGSVAHLNALNSSVVTFYGRNFRAPAGLIFDGDYVLGTGLLLGEWFDGTHWVLNIAEHTPSATILVIPDSGPKPLCFKHIAMDFNGDCKVDFSDLAVFLTHWLDSNLEPPSAYSE